MGEKRQIQFERYTNLPLGGNWAGEWPAYVLVHHEGSVDDVRYVPERTCRMVDCGSHDTCVVNRELSNGNIMSMEFGYKQCSECGTNVFDCSTVRYCPNCGAKVVKL